MFLNTGTMDTFHWIIPYWGVGGGGKAVLWIIEFSAAFLPSTH